MRTQQYDVYGAEHAVPERGRVFASQAEIREWVGRLIDQPWWHERFPLVMNVEVPTVAGRRDSVGAWFSDTQYGIIEMAKVHWNERDVVHELSHVCADSEGSTAHDPLFVRTYLELVFRVLGTDAWTTLRQSMIDHGIVIDERDEEDDMT